MSFVGQIVMIKSCRACNILAGYMSSYDGICGLSYRKVYFVGIFRFIKPMCVDEAIVCKIQFQNHELR